MAEHRVGLKEIAALSGLSIGNVSMVLRGLGDSARISKASQERVLAAARELNYNPNINAKKLRQKDSRLTIALFFAPTRHVAVMGSFFAGIHDLLSDSGSSPKSEIVIYPYAQGHLSDMDALIREGSFNGAIFMGMSSEDFRYLEELEIPQPVVLFNRLSEKHHYVYADNANIGRIAARVLHNKNVKTACLVTGMTPSAAGRERAQGFMDECGRLGLYLPEEMILRVSPRYEGGLEAAGKLLALPALPEGVFFAEDLTAVSALHDLTVAGIRIPEQMKLICYNGGSSEIFTIPALSSLQIPMDEMSRDSLLLILKAIRNPESGQMNVVHKTQLTLRESTGSME